MRYQNELRKERIKLFVPTFNIEKCLTEIRECLEIGWTGAGYKTVEFENRWNEYTAFNHSIFLNSNTIGLEIALKALRIKNAWNENDEVLTTPLTFVSTNHSIISAGLRPVFCDVDESLCIDPESVKRKITSKTRAIMFVGIGGNIGQLKQIVKICKENNLNIILDAAHLSGAKLSSFIELEEIDFAVYSFQAVKNLPTADAGMISTNDFDLATIARKLSWLGISASTFERSSKELGYKWKYDVEYIGMKGNGNSIMAAIALVQLEELEKDNLRRHEIVLKYRELLNSVSGISFPLETDGFTSTCHLMQIILIEKSRDDLITYLDKCGVDTGVHYRLNTRYGIYEKYASSCPNSEYLEERILSLPIHMRLSNDDIEYVCQSIINFMGSN